MQDSRDQKSVGSTTLVCTNCGSDTLEPGYIEDLGQGASGATRWVEGVLERGFFGGAKRGFFGGVKRMGRQHREIDVFRCTRCAHLEHFAARNA